MSTKLEEEHKKIPDKWKKLRQPDNNSFIIKGIHITILLLLSELDIQSLFLSVSQGMTFERALPDGFKFIHCVSTRILLLDLRIVFLAPPEWICSRVCLWGYKNWAKHFLSWRLLKTSGGSSFRKQKQPPPRVDIHYHAQSIIYINQKMPRILVGRGMATLMRCIWTGTIIAWVNIMVQCRSLLGKLSKKRA